MRTRLLSCESFALRLRVIAIFLVLIGMLIPVVGTIMERTRRTQTQATMTALTLAMRHYESEYGFMPFAGSTTDRKLDPADYQTLRKHWQVPIRH